MSLLQTYRRLGSAHPKYIIAVVFLSGLSGILEALGLVVAVELVGTSSNLFGFTSFSFGLRGSQGIVVFLGLGTLSVATKFLSQYYLGKLYALTEQKLRTELLHKVFRSDWQSYLGLSLGKTNEMVLGRSQLIAITVSDLTTFGSEGLSAVLCLCVAILLSPPMAIGVCLFGFIILVAYLSVKRQLNHHAAKLPSLSSYLGETIQWLLSELKYVRASGGEAMAEERVSKILSEYQNSTFLIHFYRNIPHSLLQFCGLVLLAGVFFVSLQLRWVGLGEALVFMAIFYRIVPRIQLTYGNLTNLKVREPLVRSYHEYLDRVSSLPTARTGGAPLEFRSFIEMKSVSFSYRNNKKAGVKGLSILLKKGSFTALVGQSGSGKSTVLDLLTGLLEPTHGQITVDGKNLRDGDMGNWRQKIAVVSQSVPMLHATIAENIAWLQADVDEEKIIMAAKRANAWGFIQSLPQGLNTNIGLRGMTLSGGQQQRIGLARALYREPEILILDEATSQLDDISERRWLKEIHSLRGKLTIVMVAHRMKTVQLADQICVFQNGEMAALGNWQSLSRHSEEFNRLNAITLDSEVNHPMKPTDENPLH